jgi:hypothetical protein
MGQELDDNVHEADGYRFHDVFHLACAAVLGWSPVTRRNLKRKRRSVDAMDRNEDGGRATVVEEGISALVFAYALDHNRMQSVQHWRVGENNPHGLLDLAAGRATFGREGNRRHGPARTCVYATPTGLSHQSAIRCGPIDTGNSWSP